MAQKTRFVAYAATLQKGLENAVFEAFFIAFYRLPDHCLFKYASASPGQL
jgi:hypothetical protein